MSFAPLIDATGRPTFWLADLPAAHPALPTLERQLPLTATAEPAVVILPLAIGACSAAVFWSLFPRKLAVLLAVVPRDAVFACNAAAIEKIGELHHGDSAAWEWLIRAVFAEAAITVLPPHEFVATPEWCEQLPELAPATPSSERDWLWKPLQDASAKSLVPAGSDATTVIALQAGIYQWHDYLDESHECSQQIEGEGPQQLGDYWHGIMHRREPDDTNAKYWFRRIGKQSTFPDVARGADRILAECDSPEAAKWRARITPGGKWDPFAFIDFCSTCRTRTDSLAAAARQIQFVEMSLLLTATWRTLT